MMIVNISTCNPVKIQTSILPIPKTSNPPPSPPQCCPSNHDKPPDVAPLKFLSSNLSPPQLLKMTTSRIPMISKERILRIKVKNKQFIRIAVHEHRLFILCSGRVYHRKLNIKRIPTIRISLTFFFQSIVELINIGPIGYDLQIFRQQAQLLSILNNFRFFLRALTDDQYFLTHRTHHPHTDAPDYFPAGFPWM